jgi:hypothetical protein
MSLFVSIQTGCVFTDVKLLAVFNVIASRMNKSLSVLSSSLSPYFPMISWIEKNRFDEYSEYDITEQCPILFYPEMTPSFKIHTLLNNYYSCDKVRLQCTFDFEIECQIELCQHISNYKEKFTAALRKLQPTLYTCTLPTSSVLFIASAETTHTEDIIKKILLTLKTPILFTNSLSEKFLLPYQPYLYIPFMENVNVFSCQPSLFVIADGEKEKTVCTLILNTFGWSSVIIDETVTTLQQSTELYDILTSYPMPCHQSILVDGSPSTKKTYLLAKHVSPYLNFVFQNTSYKFKGWVEHWIICEEEEVFYFVKNTLGYERAIIRKPPLFLESDYIYSENTFVMTVNEHNEVINEQQIQSLTIQEIKQNIEKYGFSNYVGKTMMQQSFSFDPYLFSKAYEYSSGDLLSRYSMIEGLLCHRSQLTDLFPNAKIYQGNKTLFVKEQEDDDSFLPLHEFVKKSFLTLSYQSLIEEVFAHFSSQQMPYLETIHMMYLDLSESTIDSPAIAFPPNAPFTIIVSSQDLFETIMDLPEKYIFLKVNAVASKEWLWFLVVNDYLFRNNIGSKYYLVQDNRIQEYPTNKIFEQVGEVVTFMNNNMQVAISTCLGNLQNRDQFEYCSGERKIFNKNHDHYYYLKRNVGVYRVLPLRKLIERYENVFLAAIRNAFLHDQDEESPYQSIKRILGYSLYAENRYVLELSPYRKKRKCIILACYIRSKLYYDALLYTLQMFCKLKETDIYLVYSTNQTNMVLPSYEWLKMIRVPNEGFDIKKYIYCLNRIKGRYDSYVLTNDSIVFLRNPSFLFNILNHLDNDFISLTDSNGRMYHYQSFFLVLTTSMCEQLLTKFGYLLNQGQTISKEDAITYFEVAMSNEIVKKHNTLCLYKFGFFNREKDYAHNNSTAIDNILRYYNESLIPFMKLQFTFNRKAMEGGETQLLSVREQVKKILMSCQNRTLYEMLFNHVGTIL